MTLVALLSILLALAPATPHPTASPAPPAISPDELFSRRALRQARLLIEMRVLELRDERLECVREALERRLPDALWTQQPSPPRPSPDVASALAKCSELMKY
jgi:hypothetical protein